NDGHAGFTSAAWLTATEATGATAMALADVNGDGRLDLVLGFDGQPVQVFLNRTGAGFAPAAKIGVARGRVAALTAGDLNGDGKPDLAIAYSDLQNKSQSIDVYTTTVTGELAVLVGRSSSLSFTNNDAPMTLALGDVNNDDALDLAVGFGERSGSAATRNQIFLNDGRAHFAQDDVQYFGSGADRTYAVALADLDDNGSLDFIAANYKERHRIYFAQAGTPQLVFAQAQGGEAREYLSVTLGDLDGNGTLDVVAGVRDGQLSGQIQKRFGIPATTMSLALADLDKKNGLDIVAGNATGQPNHVYYNDGGGSFVDEPLALGNASSDTWSVAVGDLNSDQWPDIVAGSKRQSAIYLNDSKGGFPAVPTQALGGPTDPTTSVAVGNLNGDDCPDIVVGNDNAQNAVYLNDCKDNKGHFPKEPSQRFGSEFEGTKSLALGDLDRDGDLDLVVANFYAPNVVYFNDGRGLFSTERAAYLGTLDNKTYSVALADFDGDGSLDIVAGVWATSSDIGMLALDNVIYLNDGRGGFSDARTVILTRGKHYTRAVAVGDLNGDGKPDIVFADRYNPNDGTGRLMFFTNRRRVERADAQTIRLKTTERIPDKQALAAVHPLTYSLAVPNGGCYFNRAPEISFDSGRNWRAAAVVDDPKEILESPNATSMTATRVLKWYLPFEQWEQWRDDIDLRMLLTSTVKPCQNRPPGPYQYSSFRQGRVSIPILTPLQVESKTLSGTTTIANAQVYRWAAGERLAALLSGPIESVDLNHDDRLFALWPVRETTQTVNLSPLNPTGLFAEPAPVAQAAQTEAAALAQQTEQVAASAPTTRTKILSVTRASLLYTSVPIVPASDSISQNTMPRVTTGVVTVSAPGTQTLTISSSNPLLLFNLKVALEWDAHNDRGYVAGLTRDLVRASELLYDWTNGQAALGQITLTHDAMQQT
ncbi:MAG: FG-GAP-like repeat-containing protein, partial [Anaerolineae bacterium]